ncbi:MEMBRANE-ASSOCIATED KINASE REGULATOR 5 [Hibiscus trionum]|uniref:MEMBRANE-ASSOCIATED KINASE REGULATOR 5 n=1 Tax=Hibiscus trionum TaxID=183268 RepID=A0A9W7MN00_HIBTR|nr:MEMBRANE-ASSOCIATED KINASE REGULATOR 5 [Hibiscus trionum]
MEALNFLRFWKHGHGVHKVNQTQSCNGNDGATTTTTTTAAAAAAKVSDREFDEGDDAFIDLEFPLREVEDEVNVKNAEACSLSPNDHFSKRKIMPVEPISKPQSPIALLKSAQKFRVFHPKKPKTETPKHEKQRSGAGNHFAGNGGEIDYSSKRLVQKYLKPLYTKNSKKNGQSDKVGISGDSSMLSPATVYPTKEKHGISRGVYKHLAKSKSSSAAASPINRRDDSLLLQHDGIQSAILHCKRSFNSSRESSWLMRCTSDCSSHEKLSNASSSSTDSSLFSRVTSSSARTSSEERRL